MADCLHTDLPYVLTQSPRPTTLNDRHFVLELWQKRAGQPVLDISGRLSEPLPIASLLCMPTIIEFIPLLAEHSLLGSRIIFPDGLTCISPDSTLCVVTTHASYINSCTSLSLVPSMIQSPLTRMTLSPTLSPNDPYVRIKLCNNCTRIIIPAHHDHLTPSTTNLATSISATSQQLAPLAPLLSVVPATSRRLAPLAPLLSVVPTTSRRLAPLAPLLSVVPATSR
ncbi:hypothetical protein C8R48DRAFT_781070 [Suillus tomentosus]|nr:hypothetical protein C8R48DRAFT_781070 [Suillus tomentosus]